MKTSSAGLSSLRSKTEAPSASATAIAAVRISRITSSGVRDDEIASAARLSACNCWLYRSSASSRLF